MLRPTLSAHHLGLTAVAATLLLAGCTRHGFRERADKDVAGVLTQKNVFPDWKIGSWHVYPHPDARYADPSNPDRAYNGLIDEAQVFNRALSATDVKNIYNAGTAGQFKPLAVTTSTPAAGSIVGLTDLVVIGSQASRPRRSGPPEPLPVGRRPRQESNL